jgi:predicted nicotinamide N-methyase
MAGVLAENRQAYLCPVKHEIDGMPCTIFPMKVGGHSLKLWLPDNAEKFILETTQEAFGDEERLPYWAVLWPASIALAEQLSTLNLSDKKVLELGCGLAVPSLMAAQKGAEVMATDWYIEALHFVEANAQINQLELDTKLLDWRYPPEGLEFDYILAADLLYERRNHDALLYAMDQLLRHDGTVWISDPERYMSQDFFALASEKNWHSKVHRSEVEWDGGKFKVNCWEMRKW